MRLANGVVRRVRRCIGAGLLATLAGASIAAKVNIPKEGAMDVYNCFGGDHQSIVLKENMMVGAWRLWGATYTIPAGQPFDVAAVYCFGTYSWLVDTETEHGYCDVTDADGDKFVWTYTGKNFESSGPVVAGTGKYDGMTGTISSRPVAMYPTTAPTHHHRCHRIRGTYKLK